MLELLRRVTGAATVVMLAAPALAVASRPDASPPGSGPPVRLVAARQDSSPTGPGDGSGRRVVRYVVRPGDTATGLAVRFHAWTAELVRLNRLGPDAELLAGRRLRIPVVVSAARAAARERHSAWPDRSRPRAAGSRPRAAGSRAARAARAARGQPRPDRRSRPSRAEVKRVLVRTARAYDVEPALALAVSWQEAGWQMHHVSKANAIGAMQVLPATGRWMSWYVGRPLRLHRLRDNAAAGVMLLRVLRGQAPLRRAVAGYYQGLAGVRKHGMYPDTRRYVRNVLALRRSLRSGWDPS